MTGIYGDGTYGSGSYGSPLLAVDPRDLCTVAQVRAARGTASSDTTQDTLVQDYITDASVMIMSEYGQEFAPTTASATRLFELKRGDEVISLAPYALRTVSAVSIDTDQTSSVTVSTDEYRLGPIPAVDGVYLWMRLRPLSQVLGRIAYENRQVSITGAWGYPSVPLEAKRACITTVVHWLNVNTATFPHADDSPDSIAPPKRGIPNEAREMLKRFKRALSWIG